VDWGPRDATRAVVCVHGYSGNARDFDYLAASLAKDMRVVCIDIAGRGDSDWLGSPLEYHFPKFVADIEGVLAHLGLKEVDWVGTSMGGLLGMMAASTSTSRVRRLVMNDIGAYVPLDALQAIARNLDAPASFASLDEVEAHMRHTHRDWGDLDEAQWRHFAEHGSRIGDDGRYRLHFDPQIARLARGFPPLMPGLFMWDTWYRVRCPVLLVRGERSRVFPASVGQAMIAVKPGTQRVEIEGCGHAPALMSDDEIDIVRNFIDAPADKGQWHRLPSSSSRGSPRTPTRSASRSSGSARSGPASSRT
jgi:pimeloyl-ACP methyl ester carboxylesterase